MIFANRGFGCYFDGAACAVSTSAATTGENDVTARGLGNLEVDKQSSENSNCLEYTGHVKMRDPGGS